MDDAQKKRLSAQFVDLALRDAERELLCGFPFVSQLQTLPAKKYVKYLSALPIEQAAVASRSLVKRMNEPMLLRRQPALTKEELAFVSDYTSQNDDLGRGILEDLEKAPQNSTARRTVEMRRALKRIVLDRLGTLCGTRIHMAGSEWVYSLDLGKTTIQTWLDVGGRSALRYSHSILADSEVKIATHLSILQWLGATSATRWDFLLAEQVAPAVDALHSFIKHFVTAMRAVF